jgi:hypothetical protein
MSAPVVVSAVTLVAALVEMAGATAVVVEIKQ